MLEDVNDAVGRFVEIDGDGDAAGAGDGEVGGMPLGAIGGEEADTVAGFYTEFDECRGKARYAAQELRGGDGFVRERVPQSYRYDTQPGMVRIAVKRRGNFKTILYHYKGSAGWRASRKREQQQESREQAHRSVNVHLGLEPLLALRLRSGEGVGALLAVQLLRTAAGLRAQTGRVAER